ncbi:MAG TPA: hypothetical protein VMU02_03810 [bacterium]|nr:hypothetical protein [bacterium]
MTAIGGALTRFFTLVLRPFENGNAFGGIIFISLATGAVMLVLFKLVSNQQAMKEIKTKISAYFLELRLYKEDASTVLASQGRILRTNLSYMKLAVLPAVIMIIPVVLIMIQLNLRYAHHALLPGQTAIVKVTSAPGVDVLGERLTLVPGQGVEKASSAVRIPSLGETDWKIRLTERGVGTIKVASSAAEVTIPVYATTKTMPVYAEVKKASFWDGLMNPGAPRLPAAMPVAAIEIKYPPMAFNFGLFHLSWLWTFLVVSMAFGVILKYVFKVE